MWSNGATRYCVRSLSRTSIASPRPDGRVLDGRRLHIGGVVSTDAGQLARGDFEVGCLMCLPPTLTSVAPAVICLWMPSEYKLKWPSALTQL